MQIVRAGARAPHVWLNDGRSTLDLFGRGFVLLRVGSNAPNAAPLEAAATMRGLPLQIVDVAEPAVSAVYDMRLVLVRPDGNIAWCSHDLPENPLKLIDRIRGAN